MRFGPIPETWAERLAAWFNLAPRPLVDTQLAFTSARAIMAGASLGLFDALAPGPRTAAQVAAACGTDARATRTLLGCLADLGYLARDGDRFANRPVASRWIVSTSPTSLRDKLLFQQVEWDWLGSLESFVRSGRPIRFHEEMDATQWSAYQRAMRALSATLAPHVARRLPLRRGATTMLDIGGSHGLYAAALCRRYRRLHATILELPGAMHEAAALGAGEGLGDRLVYRAGDARDADLGEAAWDLVHLSHVAHHLDASENAALAARVARALKPGGIFVIGEFDRDGGALSATTDLYFALTSASGTWSVEDLRGWQASAGLRVGRTVRYVVLPGYVSQVAHRPDPGRSVH